MEMEKEEQEQEDLLAVASRVEGPGQGPTLPGDLPRGFHGHHTLTRHWGERRRRRRKRRMKMR